MRIAIGFALSLSLWSGVSHGGSWQSCQDVFATPHHVVEGNRYFNSYQEFMGKNLVGDGTGEPMRFMWNVPYPPFVKYNLDSSTRHEFNGKRGRDFVAQEQDDGSIGIVGIGRMIVTTHVKTDDFYGRVYKNYEGKVREQLIKDLHEIDSQLEHDRTSMGLIGEKSSFRVYDGSERPFGWQFLPEMTNPDRGGTLLPFQRMNMRRDLPPLQVEAFLAREKWRGRKILELGKFSLEGSVEERARARNLIEGFWMKMFAHPYQNGIFLAHCVSEAHVRLYKRRYGFEVAESFAVPGSSEREYILWTTGRQLSSRLGALTGLGDRESRDGLPPSPPLPPEFRGPNPYAY